MSIEIGVDTGGTFTDLVCRAPGQPPRILKVPSTPSEPSEAILEALAHARREWGIDAADVTRFIHGTTVATNAVLERKGARVGLLATKGFGDVLDIGRQFRKEMYAVKMVSQVPGFLAPGARRREVPERIDAAGTVLVPLDEDAVRAAVTDLVENKGVAAIAVAYLFSFLNPTHEARTREIALELYPHLAVSLSHEVNPAFREYERTLATAFDAYVKPTLDTYLSRLDAGLKAASVPASLQVMQSRGGVASAAVARLRPIRLFLSGPAAGVVGGRIAGESAAQQDLITVDIGGTSSDIALISRGKPMLRPEGLVDGYPVRVSMVDVNAIGAGGGSIAWLDGAGGLRVGPHSAGSEPGPACYGRGGRNATVTDASIVLGYLNPAYFAGGRLSLQPELSHEVIAREIATPLGLGIEEAALGIHRVVNAQMAEGIRAVSVNQGLDARSFALVPLGGAGAVHATALAEELSIRRIVVPRHPGVLAAAGLLSAPVEHEASSGMQRRLDAFGLAELEAALAALDAECEALMRLEGVDLSRRVVSYFADLCFVGQSHHLEVPLAMDGPDPLGALYEAFLSVHDRVFGHAERQPAMLTALRVVHQVWPEADTPPADTPPDAEAFKGTRTVVLPGAGKVDARLYERERLAVGTAIEGPAIIEQADTTTVIGLGWHASVLAGGTLLLTRAENA
ncbi:hydantoinase/oxoprolinase family protein [Acuticoccus mangrovi]|uniref:Hydantoinase/oxoprolinase family protein n=1 Tax=Acuticoccus mangrovi TaxID=2796142 RepID=A0A934II46_9HYPH|nr:hydantoinase/oxoprolinase family protein [Acuticoccus mangrovi]MBJ3777139.1 hydantoinase/oxoprolinase family protein [Acuticoccus mangrovi]